MNQLNKLGIRIGTGSLIDMTKSDFDPESVDYSKVVRKGNGFSPREALEQQLSKGGVGLPVTTILNVPVDSISAERTKMPNETSTKDYLKDMNGESHHSDNDKEVAKHSETEEEIRLSLGTQDLWSQAFLATDSSAHYLDKSFPLPPPAKPSMMAKKPEKPKEEVKQEAAQKKELLGDAVDKCFAKKSEAKPEMPEGVKKKDFKKIAELHENSPGVVEKKICKSEISEAFDWIEDFTKSEGKSFGAEPERDVNPNAKKYDPKAAESVKKEEADEVAKKAAPKNNFIKAMGPGGMVFDFGSMTGNPIADNATRVLNENSDFTQASISGSQRSQIEKSVVDYVKMGDVKHAVAYGGDAQVSGNLFDPHGRLNKGMDQQVKESYARGEFQEGGPTIDTAFSKSQVKVGRETARAMSETDAAVVEMMKGMMEAQAEGGVEMRQSVTAGE